MRNVSDKVVEKIKTNGSYSVTFFNRAFSKIMWKTLLEQATDDNMAHAHCMLDT